jgi:hypothetical protein
MRHGWVALAVVGLIGCALGPFAAPFYIIYGGGAGASLLVGVPTVLHEQRARERCLELVSKGLGVTESSGLTTPSNEGDVRTFEAAWRPAFADEGYPGTEPRREAIDGKLVLTERSVLLIPPAPVAGTRIPYEGVESIALRISPATGMPHTIVIKSLCGRFDIFTFVRREGIHGLDPPTTSDVAAQLKNRVASFQGSSK